MKRHLDILNTENRDICGPCGGACCKNMPGSTHPDEWGSTPQEISEAVTKALLSGRWSVDWWEGDPRDRITEGPEDDIYAPRYTAPGMPLKEWIADKDGFVEETIDEDYLYRAMYVRPRRKGADISDPGYPNPKMPCNFLKPHGCEMKHDARPSECRSLVPDKSGNCKPDMDFYKKTHAIAWIPYRRILSRALSVALNEEDEAAE